MTPTINSPRRHLGPLLLPLCLLTAACSANLDFGAFQPAGPPPDGGIKTVDMSAGDGPGADGATSGDAAPADALAVDAMPPLVDGPQGSCQPGVDSDGDTISDLEEDCVIERDSDGDSIPDYIDPDSDNDGRPDLLEAGDEDPDTAPVDTDQDEYPDYIDGDSDNDGVFDDIEDINGDGRLGCCREACGEEIAGCPSVAQDACGPGQVCSGGACAPAVDLRCAFGESDPLVKDTHGVGTDFALGNTICSPTTARNPIGMKPLRMEADLDGDWAVILEEASTYAPAQIVNAQPKEAAATFDYDDLTQQVAGFIISRPSSASSAAKESTVAIGAVTATPPGGTGLVSLVASGTLGFSYDGFSRVLLTTLAVTLSQKADISTVRNDLMARLLSRPRTDLAALPAPIGSQFKDFVIRFTTLLRADGRVIIMGAVTDQNSDNSYAEDTILISMDLANGTALAQAGKTPTDVQNPPPLYGDRCQSMRLSESRPKVDLIWVVDESGSMDDNREDLANNANMLFTYALASGLDFRIGVTNVCTPNGSHRSEVGKFCSEASADKSHDGGVDRFLLPSEQATFSACINNPPGLEPGSEYGLVNAAEAVVRHLPRADAAPDKIRTDARLIVILATDEVPNSLSLSTSGWMDACTLGAADLSTLEQFILPYDDLFAGKIYPGATAVFNVIGGVCNNSCGADVGHGYNQLASRLGGQVFDVCQENIKNSLILMFDDIIAASSPVLLDHTPISASLKVVVNGMVVPRSQFNGFKYNASVNSIWFSSNVQLAENSVVIVSYKHWK